MTIEEQLSDAQAQLAAALATAATLQADLDTTRASATSLAKDRDELAALCAEFRVSNATLTENLSAVTLERDTLTEAAKNHAAEMAEAKDVTAAKVNAESQRLASSQGIPAPASATGNSRTSGTAKPDFSKLSGLEKAIAAHRHSASAN